MASRRQHRPKMRKKRTAVSRARSEKKAKRAARRQIDARVKVKPAKRGKLPTKRTLRKRITGRTRKRAPNTRIAPKKAAAKKSAAKKTASKKIATKKRVSKPIVSKKRAVKKPAVKKRTLPVRQVRPKRVARRRPAPPITRRRPAPPIKRRAKRRPPPRVVRLSRTQQSAITRAANLVVGASPPTTAALQAEFNRKRAALIRTLAKVGYSPASIRARLGWVTRQRSAAMVRVGRARIASLGTALLTGQTRDGWYTLRTMIEENDTRFLRFVDAAQREGLTLEQAKDEWFSPSMIE